MRTRGVAAVIIGFGVAACGDDSSLQPDSGVDAPPAITWRPCGSAECANVIVPLDYDAPSEGTINLAIIRRPATDPPQRIGTLFVNFGGPGAAAVAPFTFSGGPFPIIGGTANATLFQRFDITASIGAASGRGHWRRNQAACSRGSQGGAH